MATRYAASARHSLVTPAQASVRTELKSTVSHVIPKVSEPGDQLRGDQGAATLILVAATAIKILIVQNLTAVDFRL